MSMGLQKEAYLLDLALLLKNITPEKWVKGTDVKNATFLISNKKN